MELADSPHHGHGPLTKMLPPSTYLWCNAQPMHMPRPPSSARITALTISIRRYGAFPLRLCRHLNTKLLSWIIARRIRPERRSSNSRR